MKAKEEALAAKVKVAEERDLLLREKAESKAGLQQRDLKIEEATQEVRVYVPPRCLSGTFF